MEALIFSMTQACEAVFRYSGGIPRLVNLLCDTALVYGYAEQATRIGAPLVEDVARDKQKSRIVPLRQPAHGTTDDKNKPVIGTDNGGKRIAALQARPGA